MLSTSSLASMPLAEASSPSSRSIEIHTMPVRVREYMRSMPPMVDRISSTGRVTLRSISWVEVDP